MKFYLSIIMISLFILAGCSNSESLKELKKENNQLKQENSKLVKNNVKLKKENAALQEAKSSLKNEQSPNVDNLPNPISTTFNGSSTPDLNEIAIELFNDYLNYYKNSNGSTQQLRNYTIDKLRIEKSDKSSFVFLVEFSVQPIHTDAWLAGNGTSSEESWIHNKTFYVKVDIRDNTYTMVSHGTSP